MVDGFTVALVKTYSALEPLHFTFQFRRAQKPSFRMVAYIGLLGSKQNFGRPQNTIKALFMVYYS